MQWLVFVTGIAIGSLMMIIILSFLKANEQGGIEQEKLMAYKDGYKKGLDDGYDLKKQHTN